MRIQISNYIVDDNTLINPMYKFGYILSTESQHYTDNASNIEWLVKNINAHFLKLMNTVLNLLELENARRTQNLNINIDMQMTIINLLEYFYIKKSTILDLLDIFYKLFSNTEEHKRRLDEIITEEIKTYLNSEAEYFSEFKKLHKDEILRIRNRIIHNEGYSIKSYIENDLFLFQVYDSDLDEKLEPYFIYSHYSMDELSYKPPLIRVNDYIVSQLCNLYEYIDIYLEFLLSRQGFDRDRIEEIYIKIIESSKYIYYTKCNLSLLMAKFKELEKKIG